MATRLLNTQRIVNLSSNPASASAGEIYYNTSENKLKFYDGSSWLEIGSGGGGGGGSLVVSDTAPTTPTSGLLWYNSSNARTYIYYQDANSNQWIEIGTASVDPTGNYDAGMSNTIYGGVTGIDAGGVV